MPERQSITKISEEHELFILGDDPIKPNFFGLWHREQVSMGEVWMLYRDGLYHKSLEPGPHAWFTGFFHEWRIQKINQRIELLPITASGRVRGPEMQQRRRDVDDYDDELLEGRLAGMDEFACEVTTTLNLSCGITRFETFLRFRDPITVFLAKAEDMVNETISKLRYDQYGNWATQLRDEVKKRMQVTDSTEDLIGMRVEDVFVTDIQPNSRHDRNMLEMYQQVEKARRDLVNSRDTKKRTRIEAESYAEQGEILNIAPSILALQNSPIGRELIERDAELKKLMVAAGLNPGVSIQAIPDPQQNLLGGRSESPTGYLLPPRTTNSPQRQQLQGPLNPQTFSGPLNPQTFSGPLNPQGNTAPYARQTMPQQPIPAQQPDLSIEQARIKQELDALQAANFMCSGEGQFTPTYDGNGQPIPGSKEWILEVYSQHNNDYLTLVFHCSMNYPAIAPRVQMRAPGGNGRGFQWIEPNTIRNWNPNRLLVEVAQELAANI